jgi:putative transposase
MIKAYIVRLLPNQAQEQLLWQHVNIARFTWNYGLTYQLERFKNNEKHLSGYDLRKVFTEMKKLDTYSWLKEISSHTIYNVVLDLDDAYKKFFKKLNGKPKFKSKNKCKQSFPVRQDSFYLNNNCANIEKIGKIKYQTDYTLPQGRDNKFSNPRIKFENDKWILTFGMEHDNQVQELTDDSIGIDLGIKELAYISCGNDFSVIKNINKSKKVIKIKKKLKRLQRKVSKKYEMNKQGKKFIKTNNIIKLEKQIKQLHTKLKNIRKNHIHQATSKVIKMNSRRIVMEDLNVSGMMKNKHLSKAIQEQCFYEFIRQMKYKSEFNGREFVQADRFYPSSKTCSCCGNIKKELKLSDRVYICDNCGLVIDRDKNASINLMNYKSA